MTQTYEVRVGDEVRYTFEADLTQASAPICVDGTQTMFQTADARHRPSEAARLVNGWMDSQGGAAVEADEEYTVHAM